MSASNVGTARRAYGLAAALALASVFGDPMPEREPIRTKDPAADAERIAAAQLKRERKAQKRIALAKAGAQ